eukprot:gene328-211_t
MGGGGGGEPAAPEPPVEPGSGFSFMAGAAPEPVHDGDSSQANGSGFSFLSSPQTEAPSESASSFSFMSHPPAHEEPVKSTPLNTPPPKDLMSMEVHQPQDVKLAKVASTKVVKKKKKATRVGFGRDDDEDDVTPTPSVHSTPHIIQGPVEAPPADEYVHHELPRATAAVEVVEATHAPHDAADDLDLPPVPPPGYRPDTPPNRESIVAEDASVVQDAGGAASMFSGFSFVNNNGATTSAVETPVASTAVEEPVSSSSSSGFGFLSSSSTTTTPAAATIAVEEVPTTQPSSFSFLSAATAPPAQPEPEPEEPIPSSTETEFGVPGHILQALHTESRKLSQSIQGFVSLYNGAYDLFTQLMADVIVTSQACRELAERIDHLEQQQTILAEREEFEQAAVISAEIEQIQSQWTQQTAEKERALETLKKVKHEYDHQRPSVTAAFSNSFDSVFAFVAEAKDIDVQGRKQLDDYVKEEIDRLSVEEQRIHMEASHCEREQATLHSESAVVEEAINTQVGDQLERKRDLEVQSFAVQEEIRRLEELLAQKRAEDIDIAKQMKQIDTKILEVRKKYERQLARIAERREALSKAQSECAYEAQIVADNRSKVESIVAEALESYRILSVQAETKQQEVRLAETFMKDVHMSIEAASTAEAESEHPPSFSLDFSWYLTESDELYRCFSSGDHLSSSSKELSDRVTKMEQAIRQHDQQGEEQRAQQEVAQLRLKTLVDTIDRLEVEKKGHAANKRFKEAANTAKELKEANEAKDQVEQAIKAVQASLASMDVTKQQLVRELEDARRLLREEQKVEKMVHYQIVRRHMRTCVRIKHKVETVQQRYPSDFTETLLDLYAREYDRLQRIRAVLVRECDIDESTLSPDVVVEEEAEPLVAEQDGEDDDAVPTAAENQDCGSVDALLTLEDAGEAMAFSLSAGGDPAADVVASDLLLGVSEGDEIAAEVVDTAAAADVPVVEEVVVEEEVPVPEIDREAVLADIAALEKEMEQAADAEDYDQAAVLMDKITELKASIGLED